MHDILANQKQREILSLNNNTQYLAKSEKKVIKEGGSRERSWGSRDGRCGLSSTLPPSPVYKPQAA